MRVSDLRPEQAWTDFASEQSPNPFASASLCQTLLCRLKTMQAA